jgi:hypothetical protein
MSFGATGGESGRRGVRRVRWDVRGSRRYPVTRPHLRLGELSESWGHPNAAPLRRDPATIFRNGLILIRVNSRLFAVVVFGLW